MKKFISLTFVLCAFLLVLVACGSNTKTKEKNADESFMSDLSKGLEKRWDIAEEFDKIKDPTSSETKKYYDKFINAELDSIKSYKDKKFKDTKLQSLMLQYINVLNDSKDITGDMNSLDGLKKWSELYDNRTKILLQFKNDYGLKVDSKYQSTLNDLEKDGQKANKEDEVKNKVTSMVDNIKFTYKAEAYDDNYKKYQSTVENTTGVDFKNFSGQVNLLDDSGVTVSSTYISTDNWKAGSKVLFEFTTDKAFTKTVITPTYNIEDN
ncbi:FxLYD domain-containing protein [Lactococcus lactis]|uniref:FxLYD domain-containing protein n=1 Tax=Lactococcus lactis TaxID=1358 RepID=UPI00071E6651|nr:FxLYD domain-containing protein [Lactococcus lactis]KST85939.1 hypothetical protein LK337_0627 [Lactococcus lactis subsp. lactis]